MLEGLRTSPPHARNAVQVGKRICFWLAHAIVVYQS